MREMSDAVKTDIIAGCLCLHANRDDLRQGKRKVEISDDHGASTDGDLNSRESNVSSKF